jgi:hypothetical protein
MSDGRAADQCLDGEVELIDGLDRREKGRPDPLCAVVVVASVGLFSKNRGEIVLEVPAIGASRVSQATDRGDPRRVDRP